MPDIESHLKRWKEAGLLDDAAAARIREYESQSSGPQSRRRFDLSGMRWQGMTALVLAAILLACGVALFVSSHWDEIGSGSRFALALAVVGVFHLAGGLVRESLRPLSTALHAVGTLLVGPGLALVGQIFNIEEHWPAAVLLWALAAVAGWMLLRDEVQQTLALLLIPAWMFSELADAMENHIGGNVYMGRALFAWAILYLTFFSNSRRRAVYGILFAASAIAAVVGVVAMLASWVSYVGEQSFIPFGTCVWAWIVIAAIPLIVAAFHGHKGLIPIAVSIAFVLALPWCHRAWTESYTYAGSANQYTRTAPNLAAHVLVAAFAVFLCWWGVRLASHALVNLGIAGFAAAVFWFYFSDIFDELGRALGLIVLGILFLAGGWALEAARRRILKAMTAALAPIAQTSSEEAQ